MKIKVRRTCLIRTEQLEASGRIADPPLRKLGVVFIVENPFAGTYVDDLSPIITSSAEVGRAMADLALASWGEENVQSYGKGGIVGLDGEQEHANALLTTTFANPIRDAIGGAGAWISSVTKMGSPGTPIDVPMNHIDDVYVRSHYDAMTIVLPDAPMPDEVALVFCFGNRGRLNARVGGLTHAEVATRRRRGPGG